MSDSPLVSLEAISVRLGRSEVLRDITFVVEAGEIVGISGPNGAGKSTLLRTVATLLRPSGGSGTVLGARLASREAYSVRTRIGLLAHDPALYPELTLRENLEMVARLSGQPHQRAAELLAGVGLEAASDRRVSGSSHGMRRRVDIARLFLTRPELVLLDEAHAGLDDAAVSLISTLVGQTVARGGAALLVSHDSDYLKGITDRRWALGDGRLETSE